MNGPADGIKYEWDMCDKSVVEYFLRVCYTGTDWQEGRSKQGKGRASHLAAILVRNAAAVEDDDDEEEFLAEEDRKSVV